MNRISRIVSACAFAVGLAGCAGTQEVTRFPTQPVKIVVPYPAGNATDVVGRIVAEKLAQLWGQPVSIENRSGIPAVDGVAKSKPDGYTLLAHSISYAVDAGLYTNLPYDPEKDIVAVAPFARQPFALVASPTLGAKNVADLVAKAKAGQFQCASLGPTSQLYFIAEQFQKKTGFNASNVTYKSLAEALKHGLREKAIRGGGAMLFSRSIGLAIHVISAAVLARLLTPADFGLVTMVTAFSLLFYNAGLNGFREAIIQKDGLQAFLR